MDEFEEKTKEYFDSNGFPIEKIEKGVAKTPDFEGDRILIEVKSVQPQKFEVWLESESEEELEQDMIESEEKLKEVPNDSTYNTVNHSLQQAARQFRAHDPEHIKKHLVVIFSKDVVRDDVYSVWTGKYSPDISTKFLRGGMMLSGEHRKHIDAVAWFKNVAFSAPVCVWLASNEAKKYFPEVEGNR